MVSSPVPHTSHSPLEADVCAELRRQSVSHEHRSLHFRVHPASGPVAEFTPDLVVRRGSILFLIEPLEGGGAADRGRLEFLERFLDTHSPEIVLVIVTPDADVTGLPPGSYDEAYPSKEISRMVHRIRTQDPKGVLLPFKKPAAASPDGPEVREDG